MAMLERLKIDANSIVQLEADSNYTNIRLIDGRVITSSYTMHKIKRVLPDTFVRNTRSMCVNTTHASPIYFSRRRKKINL
jgi:DNA-binding LytR/AlgR family response regulator